MKTSADVVTRLHEAQQATVAANETIAELVAVHDYQDVAQLVTQAATELLKAAAHYMEKDSNAALDAVERAEDLLDTMYDIIENDLQL